ncbi:MAG: urea transporter [Bacteroidetes bacterium]|nr:urea transporter [Bacteroidota bacterium]
MDKVKSLINSTVRSYSQIFFSVNKIIGLIIFLITFIDIFTGICTLTGVLFINFLAKIFGCYKSDIDNGIFGFNAVLLSMAFTFEYKFNGIFLPIFFISIILLFLLTVYFQNRLNNKGLPFLTFPFLITYWIIFLSLGNVSFIEYQDKLIYLDNYQSKEQLSAIYNFVHCLDSLQLPQIVSAYFKTLSSVFFQSSVLVGLVLSLGILYTSRIAFSTTIIGFAAAYYWLILLGLDLNILVQNLQGTNFIFMAIALGSFFILPNYKSYLAVFFLAPIVVLFLITGEKIFNVFQLKTFTLSFSLVTILFLIFVKNRYTQNHFKLIAIQYYSPEKALYKTLSNAKHLKNTLIKKFEIPCWGKWKITQGYFGKITHLGDWANALDFSIVDKKEKTYMNYGEKTTDFYAYDKPVLASAEGYVYDITNNVNDNNIGDVDTENNWGNTIIINHMNGIFSQISHLKKDSIKVDIGNFITKDTQLANCGNSGRSPEPHIHFQIQLSPVKGSKTLAYPLTNYILYKNNEISLKTFETPKENDIISRIDVSKNLSEAFNLKPNSEIILRNEKDLDNAITWKINTDSYNNKYIKCEQTNSTVWFNYDGAIFSTYDFEGDTKSLLFDFYLATHKILLASYKNLKVEDFFPTMYFCNSFVLFFQDFIAPFGHFTKSKYISNSYSSDNIFSKEETIKSSVANVTFSKKLKERNFEIIVKDNKLKSLSINNKEKICKYIFD